MCLSSLSSDVQLQRFNRELRRYNYDLLRWKRSRRFHARETTLLDADGGAGWELAAQLLSEVPKKRPSAGAAKAHRWFRVSLDPSLPASYEAEPDSSVSARLPTPAQRYEGSLHRSSSLLSPMTMCAHLLMRALTLTLTLTLTPTLTLTLTLVWKVTARAPRSVPCGVI